MHSTHFWLAELQAGFGAEHWVPVRHSTHVFVLSSQTGAVPLHAGVHADAVPPVATLLVDVPALVPPALVPPRLEPPTLEPPAPLEFVSLVLFPPELAPPERVLLSPELVPPTPPSLRSTSAQERLEAQSEPFVHCTHCSVPGLHTGFGAEQLLSVVHCTQVFFEVSQTGVAAVLEQWVFPVHGTQTFFEVSHAGFGAEQLLSVVHSTHFWLAELQAGFGAEH